MQRVLSRLVRRQGRARAGAAVLAFIAVAAVSGCDASEDADIDRGRALFQSKCGTCHTLAEAGTSATVGPDLDAAFLAARADGQDNDTIEGVVQGQIANPRPIAEDDPHYSRTYMPPDIVTGQDAEDVATYVGQVAGVPGAAPPELPPDQLFIERCGSCHTLSAAGTTGTTGPDLDDVLAGKDAEFIEQQIVNPDSAITPGYGPGIMPQDFGTSLSDKDLKGLVDYLLQNAGQSGQ